MYAKPQAEHEWLHQVLGDWIIEHECTMPDGTVNRTTGKMHCRSLGGMWLICESSGHAEESGEWSSIMTVGFDPAKGEFVGTFIGSMMGNIWPYRGQLDESGKRLPLLSEGPKFTGDGIGQYRDTIEIVDKDNWNFLSELQDDDGRWVQFMTGKHTRA
ncbi:MAG: DUF1579 domain-containing protein [Pirellulaceae bacterium]